MAELIDFLMRLLKIGLGLCIFVGPFIWLIYAQREYNKAYGHEPDDDDGSEELIGSVQSGNMDPIFSPTWDRVNDCAAPFWSDYWGSKPQSFREDRSIDQENAWLFDEMYNSGYDPYDPYA